MAFIKDHKTGKTFPVKAHHTFGRKAGVVDTQVSEEDVSGIHANITWDGSSWEFVDSSRNGSFLNSEAIQTGDRLTLQVGDYLGLSLNAPRQFEFLDSSAPQAMLYDHGTDRYTELEDFTPFPSAENPVVSLFKKNQNWVLERDGVSQEINDGEILSFDQIKLTFFDPTNHEQTKKARKGPSRSKKFLFTISPSHDLEEVKLTFQDADGKVKDLGTRNPYFLLYILANSREEDNQKGISIEESGWIQIDLLCNMLKQELNHINIQVYRLRKILVDACDRQLEPSEAIERRKTSVRLGFDQFKIFSSSH